MLKVHQLSFSYNTTSVLEQLNFEVRQGEHVSVIGESGSGKSTLLKLLHGEYDLDQGEIFWKDEQILGPKYNLVVGYEFMKYVAQEFDLMPFTSVAENVGKFLSNFYPEEKKERIAELLEVVELTDFANTKVKTLSGGQKQRVALARAIAKQPEIILLDEPFSHIDNFQKQSLRRKVFKYLKDKNITCIVATHDRDDVLGFSDRMLVLNNTKIAANAAPKALYKNPETALVAAFFREFNSIDQNIVYAHQLQVVENSDLKAKVIHSYFKGAYYLIEAETEQQQLFFEHPEPIPTGTDVSLVIKI
ncbi:ABC transporter ATP-binding protein [Subsaximicrobium wynnwilliamsii]|uniref:ABC transporter ATP-binding protein n=1 Tax=Subsaximicrobium wynnwilliamsii TaxID=291179 RepID=A0A5C6ZF38_9FLAO|nr:ABC transporter ATP-binding protein [Subsaximicrobium wynnwilliamsii]TXD82712.1 ABC transporter ATP-binding protein [Subsaximicrobium wynnwilliamsii]TXD88447.1 ABC transporter ATP-binding protein [Subsaximicrobium wynnwilliamsii]TXE02374.1 ABC transporter ATP-binding protein [Subsaximicrobium wynnwilliamsii]